MSNFYLNFIKKNLFSFIFGFCFCGKGYYKVEIDFDGFSSQDEGSGEGSAYHVSSSAKKSKISKQSYSKKKKNKRLKKRQEKLNMKKNPAGNNSSMSFINPNSSCTNFTSSELQGKNFGVGAAGKERANSENPQFSSSNSVDDQHMSKNIEKRSLDANLTIRIPLQNQNSSCTNSTNNQLQGKNFEVGGQGKERANSENQQVVSFNSVGDQHMSEDVEKRSVGEKFIIRIPQQNNSQTLQNQNKQKKRKTLNTLTDLIEKLIRKIEILEQEYNSQMLENQSHHILKPQIIEQKPINNFQIFTGNLMLESELSQNEFVQNKPASDSMNVVAKNTVEKNLPQKNDVKKIKIRLFNQTKKDSLSQSPRAQNVRDLNSVLKIVKEAHNSTLMKFNKIINLKPDIKIYPTIQNNIENLLRKECEDFIDEDIFNELKKGVIENIIKIKQADYMEEQKKIKKSILTLFSAFQELSEKIKSSKALCLIEIEPYIKKAEKLFENFEDIIMCAQGEKENFFDIVYFFYFCDQFNLFFKNQKIAPVLDENNLFDKFCSAGFYEYDKIIKGQYKKLLDRKKDQEEGFEKMYWVQKFQENIKKKKKNKTNIPKEIENKINNIIEIYKDMSHLGFKKKQDYKTQVFNCIKIYLKLCLVEKFKNEIEKLINSI